MSGACCGLPILRPTSLRPLWKAVSLAPSRLGSCSEAFRSPGPTSAPHSDSFSRIDKASSAGGPTAHNGLVGGSNPPGPTTQCCATGDFLKVYERPRIGGDLCHGSFSVTASLQSAGRLCAFFSGPEIPLPGNGDYERQRLGANAGYAEGTHHGNMAPSVSRISSQPSVNKQFS